MKTEKIIATANESIKVVANDLRDGNKEYTSISRVLKDIQRKEMLRCGYGKVFAALGLDADNNKVTPQDFFNALEPEQWGKTVTKSGKVSEPWVGIWGMATVKDENGKKVMVTVNGVEVPKTEPKLRKVTAWSPNKIFKVYAQALAIRAQKAEEKKSAK